MQKVLMLSIKPQYVNKIFEGTKLIELRKTKPNVLNGDLILIYCTSPRKAIVGYAKVKEIIVESPSCIWNKYRKQLGICKTDYFEYFHEKEHAVGIVLCDVKKIEESLDLDSIKIIHPNFQPPQSFHYYSFKEVIRTYHDILNFDYSY